MTHDLPRHSRMFCLFLLLAFFMFSCGNKNNKPPFSYFKTKQQISGTPLQDSFVVNDPVQIELLDSLLFVVDYYTGKDFINVYNVASKKVYKSFCKKGIDSAHYVAPISIQVNRTRQSIGVYGRREMSYAEFPIRKITAEEEFTPKKLFFRSNSRLSGCLRLDTFFMCDGFFQKRIRLIDTNSKTIADIINYPLVSNDFNPIQKRQAYQGNMIVNENGTEGVSTSAFCDNIVFFKLANGNGTIIKEYLDRKPDFQYFTMGGAKIFRPVRKNAMGFLDLKGTKSHVYALYSGKERDPNNKKSYVLSNTVLVYDWSGRPEKLIQLDQEIRFFAVDENEKFLIGITYNPGAKLYRFEL